MQCLFWELVLSREVVEEGHGKGAEKRDQGWRITTQAEWLSLCNFSNLVCTGDGEECILRVLTTQSPVTALKSHIDTELGVYDPLLF